MSGGGRTVAGERRLKVGFVLPHFRPDADAALEMARQAEELGIDGVFCYDHLWPMGQPTRPALVPLPVLGAVAARTTVLTVGTLVARVGLVPTRALADEMEALDSLAPGRVVAGLGTGDAKSVAENRAYGLADQPAAERRSLLADAARELARRGLEVWIGGGSPATRAVAETEGVALNLWAPGVEELAEAAGRGAVTWAGPPPPRGLAELLGQLAATGATWAVFGPPPRLSELAAASASLRSR